MIQPLGEPGGKVLVRQLFSRRNRCTSYPAQNSRLGPPFIASSAPIEGER